jgi:hypothetical protein
MDRLVHIDVALITKITGLPTVGAQPKEYLDNKENEKEITKIVKEQFGTKKGNRGIVLRDINDEMTTFYSNLMACKLLRNYRKKRLQQESS